MPGYPLSPVQQGMLFHSLYGEDCGVYLQQFIWDLREMLDVSAFERAWQRVIERHAILRTSFHWRDTDKPLQMVHQRVDCPLEIQDWRGLPDREERFSAYLKTDRARGFDFTASPVMRRALFRLKEAEYRFLWTYHHALLDGRSRLLIVQEIFAFYEGFCRGRALALPLPPPYQDYIEWLQSQDFSKAKAFWRQMLNGLSAPTPLIEERAGKPVEEKAPHAEKTLNLTKAETENLHALARTADITLNTLVQSAWTLLLSRYSGEETVLFGATRGGRHSPSIDIKFMAGLFINTLPVRIQVMPDQSLSAWLQYVRKQWLSIREHEHTPLILAQEWSEMPAGVPLFESIIVLENYDFNTVFQARGGKWARRRFKLLQHTHYPLTLMVTTGAELQFALEYDTHRFSAGTIKDMLCHLQILLNGMADNPRQPVSALPMLGEAERHCLLTEWNNTESRYPHDKCLHQLFEAQAERTPDAPAVLFEQRQLTYRTLNVRANQLAHYLRTLAAGPEVLIALCAERSPEMLIALLGILKAGSAYIPLDPAYPEDRLAFMLEDAQAPVLLTQESLAGKFVQSRQNFQIVCLDRERERAEISRQNDNNPPCTAHPENLAYVIYTSGSTGKPKGVQIAHRSLVNFLWSMRREPGLTEQDILLAVTTISFDIAALELYLPLLTGACIVLASRETAADGPELLKKLAGVTVMQATPATWRLLLVSLAHDSKIQRNSEAPDLKGLKILCGGEALTPDLAGRLLKIGGEVWNLYGPTETTVWSAACRITEEPRKKGKNTSVSIGRPIANTQIYILDRRLQPVPAGVAGELYIGGAGLARGYLKRPELNANSFINQSGYFSDEPEARLYKTGDLARHLPDGRIECLGRADNQVKLRGFRIEPGEIEAALAKHPGVLQCAAIVRKDSSADDKRLTGYVVPEGEQTPSGEELRDFLKKTLPDYMVPGIFVMLEALPLTPNGKIDRRALPVPGRFHKSSKNGRVAPRDNVELQLLQIWEQVLNIHPISVRDDFFALGGHSLLAVSLMAKIQKKFGKQLPLSALFRGATVELLAAVLRRGPLPESPLAAIQPNGAKPPFFAVHPIGGNVLCYAGLARHLGSEQPFYGLQANDIKEKGNSIEEMASHYLRTLREIQPQGPYRLGGWSFGGVVAFEMARQLYEQGQETALLALIDAKIPAEQPLDIDTEKLLASLVGNLGGLHACKLHVSSAELRRLDIYKQLNLILKQAMQYHIFPPEAGPKQIYRLLVTFKACRDALCRYVPSPYPGRITLFQSSEDSKGMDWTGLAAEIKIHNIPAGHYEIIREPHVRTLALQLTACLDKV